MEQYEMQNGYILLKDETERVTSTGLLFVVGADNGNTQFLRVIKSKSDSIKEGEKVLVAKSDLISIVLEKQNLFLIKEEEVLAIADN